MKYTLLLICALMMVGCVTTTTNTNTADSPKKIKGKPGRSITLDVDEYGILTFTDEEHGPIESWACRERYSDDKTILFEVGRMKNPNDSEYPYLGFFLYDGTSSGEVAMYYRQGLNHRWDWEGPHDGKYSFVIEPDGTGAYYDFSNVAEDETTQASSMYECTKR